MAYRQGLVQRDHRARERVANGEDDGAGEQERRVPDQGRGGVQAQGLVLAGQVEHGGGQAQGDDYLGQVEKDLDQGLMGDHLAYQDDRGGDENGGQRRPDQQQGHHEGPAGGHLATPFEAEPAQGA